MEPCYTLHHHGTKRSLDPAMSSERSSVGRVAEGGRSEPVLLGGERGTRESSAGSIVPRLSHTWEKPWSCTTGSYYEASFRPPSITVTPQQSQLSPRAQH
ncbi:hypothetical protein QQF64_005749 [Cirrhinus molitorella]|uniref:Uncharacterized protein n=1 Tax=Cirrhinus molitorella TaxID=172907 RepID=A0ABR3MDM6_9TELE